VFFFQRCDNAIGGAEETQAGSRRVKPLEPLREPVAIRAILEAARQINGSAVQPFQGFQHRAVILTKQPRGDMQPVVRVDADQMGVECSMMDF
jgi:hypothetical protein